MLLQAPFVLLMYSATQFYVAQPSNYPNIYRPIHYVTNSKEQNSAREAHGSSDTQKKKKIPAFYGTLMSITTLKRARRLSLSYKKSTQFVTPMLLLGNQINTSTNSVV